MENLNYLYCNVCDFWFFDDKGLDTKYHVCPYCKEDLYEISKDRLSEVTSKDNLFCRLDTRYRREGNTVVVEGEKACS